jgi:hypothetical protein
LYLWHAEIVATFGQKRQPSSPSIYQSKTVSSQFLVRPICLERGQAVRSDDQCNDDLHAIGDCDRSGQESAAAAEPGAPEGCAAKPRKRRKPQNALELTLAAHPKRILGLDLTTIPVLNVLAVLSLVSKIGTNMSKWRHERRVRLLAGVKSQPQNQWTAGVKLAPP